MTKRNSQKDTTAKPQRSDTALNKELFLKAMVDRRGNITAACEMVGVSRQRVYAWKKDDPEFLREFNLSRKKLVDILFEKACKLGEEGDSTLLIFSLKSLDRRRFDDRFAQLVYTTERGLNPDGTQPQGPTTVVLLREQEPERVRVQNADSHFTDHVEQ